jgi:hypothetical protein
LRVQFCTTALCSLVLGVSFSTATPAYAQWQIERSGTTASLRGIHAVSADVAWASGTGGTLLRTLDGGQSWSSCAVPAGAEKLDFRSVWAWDADHAMVLSSGPAGESKLYSTHDGCRTWRLVLSNPDVDGFWDALQFDGTRFGVILGDPVQGSFTMFVTYDGGSQWTRQVNPCLRTMDPKQGAFAASNQSLVIVPLQDANSPAGTGVNHQIWFGTSGGWLYSFELAPLELISTAGADSAANECTHVRALPLGGKDSAGIFAVAFHDQNAVAVGGDYAQPQSGTNTAAFTLDSAQWHVALHPPAGYRSTVAWDATDGSWIAAGSHGSDVSRDNGNTWQPLDHANWNAISLPFAVGPDGRIGRLVSWGQLRVLNRPPEANSSNSKIAAVPAPVKE